MLKMKRLGVSNLSHLKPTFDTMLSSYTMVGSNIFLLSF